MAISLSHGSTICRRRTNHQQLASRDQVWGGFPISENQSSPFCGLCMVCGSVDRSLDLESATLNPFCLTIWVEKRCCSIFIENHQFTTSCPPPIIPCLVPFSQLSALVDGYSYYLMKRLHPGRRLPLHRYVVCVGAFQVRGWNCTCTQRGRELIYPNGLPSSVFIV